MIYFWWALVSLLALAGAMTAEHNDSRRSMTRLAFIVWCVVCSIPFINVIVALLSWGWVATHVLPKNKWFSAPLYKKK